MAVAARGQGPSHGGNRPAQCRTSFRARSNDRRPGEHGLKVAYLINQYPKVSHSFIRREILALERRGVQVQRYAMRGWDAETPDPADAHERAHTRYLLRDGIGALLPSVLRA